MVCTWVGTTAQVYVTAWKCRNSETAVSIPGCTVTVVCTDWCCGADTCII